MLGRDEEVQMRKTWLYALPLALAALYPMSASASGRQPNAPIATEAAYADADPDAAATTLVFKDALRPHGRDRSAAVRHADGRACGASAELVTPTNIPAFKQCMASHGWRFAYAYQTPASSAPQSQSQSDSDAQAALNQSNADETSRRIDDDVRHDDEMNATIAADNAQAANDASNAATAAAVSAAINQ
jgi:hypothetical protein